ncbi:MAG: ABC transporter ATP-binding protein [Myxococcota bacterium]|nr:ABC transporter ATP-binding protein [Myxococcota bacterium]
MADPCLEFHDLSHGWVDSPPLFQNFNAELEAGQITALVGLSGCGKSTLLKLAAGLLLPQAGSIVGRYQRSAMVFQSPSLLPWRTATRNTALPLELRQHPDADTQAQQMLDKVGLQGAYDKLPHEMSGGMKMRCAIARALVVQPDLLFLDEAFSALDALTRRDVHALFLQLYSDLGFTALMVTHDIEEAVLLADRIWVLKGPEAATVESIQVKMDRPRAPSWRHSSDFGAVCASVESAL